MIKIENINVYGWEAAIRGMRSPMNSWDKSDTIFDGDKWCMGQNDLSLMRKLAEAGNDHAKFLRMINVTMDITAPHFWWAEFDTYKVGTVRNSCSKMHKIHVKEFVIDDFSTESVEECGGRTIEVFICVLNELERLRRLFNETHEKKYWRAIIELLPMGYNLKATVQLNYQVLKNMYFARRNHKLKEWHTFCDAVLSLPYFEAVCINMGEA